MKPKPQLRFHRASSPQHQGSALVATLLVVAALVAFLSIAGLITGQFSRYAGREQGDGDLLAAADAGLEYAYGQWKATTATLLTNGKPPVSSAFSGMDNTMLANMNSSSQPFAAKGITFTAVNIRLASTNGVPDTTSTTAPGTPSSVLNYPGWTGTSYNYVATVTVSPATVGAHYGFSVGALPTITVKRYFQVQQVPLFQAAIFYENKLEIHPGAAMTVTGLIHTNQDLWARGFSTLAFKNNVSYVGSYNEVGDATVTKGWDGDNGGYIPGVGYFAGVPYVTWADGLVSGQSSTKATQLNQVSPIDPFGGTLSTNNGLHQMIEVPSASTTIPVSQTIYANSSLIITVDSSTATADPNHVVITDGSGNSLSVVDTAAVKAAINNGVATNIYDQREGSNVTLTTLDMAKLATATVAKPGATVTGLQSIFASGGTVYIQDVSKSANTEKGIRLVNGSTLGQDVSVASNNGVYIQGDYNTGGTGNAVPSNVSNNDGSATPNVAGYTRNASAVMADAVTILSNNWQDSNSAASLSARTATPTTVNVAIMSGDVPSNYNGNQTASGGAHNFPRFLENWNNVNFTYWGSLVEAYRSEKFDGLWQTGNVYYWPNRKWNFDTNFLNKQPPGFPNGVQYSRGRWQRTS